MVKEAGKAERELKELSAQQKGFVAKQLAKLAGEEGGGEVLRGPDAEGGSAGKGV